MTAIPRLAILCMLLVGACIDAPDDPQGVASRLAAMQPLVPGAEVDFPMITGTHWHGITVIAPGPSADTLAASGRTRRIRRLAARLASEKLYLLVLSQVDSDPDAIVIPQSVVSFAPDVLGRRVWAGRAFLVDSLRRLAEMPPDTGDRAFALRPGVGSVGR